MTVTVRTEAVGKTEMCSACFLHHCTLIMSRS
jgi:hypothetical protein